MLRDVAVPSVGGSADGMTDRGVLSMEGIWDFAMTVELDDVRDLLDRQIACNGAIVDEGLAGDWGANIGSVMLGAYGDDVRYACASPPASDARMSGCGAAVVINSGSGKSGHHRVGAAHRVRAPPGLFQRAALPRARAVEPGPSVHQKTGIGRLSAFCGAVLARRAGAGIAYLDGGDAARACHAW